MKVTIIGSTQYVEKMKKWKHRLQAHGVDVRLPAFDDHPELDSLGVCKYNRDCIEWADEVHLFWDNRSSGSIFDLGMVFALRKPPRILYIEEKTFQKVFEAYEQESTKELGGLFYFGAPT